MTTTDAVDRQPRSAPTAGDALRVAVPMLVDYLDDIATRLHRQLGSVGGVAVTVDIGQAPLTVGSSSELALATDLLQYAIGLGPCLHALETGEGMYIADLARDDRWRDYGPRAAALGAASCLSAPVIVDDEVLAVLKVYAGEVDAITPAQQHQAGLVAVEIGGGIRLARRLTEQAVELDDRAAAMTTRRIIDLSIGILMERNHADAAESFDLVRRYSQHYNLKLHDAARKIVDTVVGSGPDEAPFKRRAPR